MGRLGFHSFGTGEAETGVRGGECAGAGEHVEKVRS